MTQPYTNVKDMQKLFLKNLEINANIMINCLINIKMIANSKKFQLMFLARNKNVEKETVYAGKTK